MKITPTTVHSIAIERTKAGGYYARCLCEWRSPAFPQVERAEAAMRAHAKSIPGRRRDNPMRPKPEEKP